MLFPSIEFFIFFILVLPLNWALASRPRLRYLFLCAASYVFYSWWNWRLAFLLAACSLMNWGWALFMGRIGERSEGARRAILVAALASNLGILAFFKYYGFFVSSLNTALLGLGFTDLLPQLSIALPVGISFYTFHGMSYVIDVHRGQLAPRSNATDIFLYLSFFPQLVAGPIVRAKDFLPQLDLRADAGAIPVGRAFALIAFGLFKKVVIATYLAGGLVDPVFNNPGGHAPLDLLLAVYGYAVQIFCDFSAYTDIAIGIAHLLGFTFPDNFDNPYRSASLQEFWRRWHISLSSWLRDYLYIGLGGSRKGKFATYRNLLVTMLLGGLWHGANWTFVIWGAIHGFGLSVERGIRDFSSRPTGRARSAVAMERAPVAPARVPSRLSRAVGIFATFHVVCLAWIFFRCQSLDAALSFFAAFGGAGSALRATPFLVGLIVFGIGIQYLPRSLPTALVRGFERLPFALQSAALAVVLVAIAAFGPEGVAPFIYFQF